MIHNYKEFVVDGFICRYFYPLYEGPFVQDAHFICRDPQERYEYKASYHSFEDENTLIEEFTKLLKVSIERDFIVKDGVLTKRNPEDLAKNEYP